MLRQVFDLHTRKAGTDPSNRAARHDNTCAKGLRLNDVLSKTFANPECDFSEPKPLAQSPPNSKTPTTQKTFLSRLLSID